MLQDYHNKRIRTTTFNKLSSHLWYLSEALSESVALAFFDQDIPDDMKRQMVVTLCQDVDEESSKCAQGEDCANKFLGDFVSMNMWRFFQKIKSGQKFLDEDPSTGKDEIGYQSVRRLVQSIEVTNDNAGRGVALIQEYSQLIPRDEGQLQFLSQVLSEHRCALPDCKKSTQITGK